MGKHPLNLFLNSDEALYAFGTNLEFAASEILIQTRKNQVQSPPASDDSRADEIRVTPLADPQQFHHVV